MTQSTRTQSPRGNRSGAPRKDRGGVGAGPTDRAPTTDRGTLRPLIFANSAEITDTSLSSSEPAKPEAPLWGAGGDKTSSLGKAAEYLVCADLCLSGLLADLSVHPSSSFDLVAEIPGTGRLLRVQVKSTFARTAEWRGTTQVMFAGTRSKKTHHQRRYDHIDFFAFVEVKSRTILYLSKHRYDVRLTGKSFDVDRFAALAKGSLQRCLEDLLTKAA